MSNTDEGLQRLARAAISWKRAEDNLGQQMIRESMGLDNWAKKAYQSRRQSKLDLEEAIVRYIQLQEHGQVPESG